MKTVLILGGCGLVGSFIAEILLKRLTVNLVLADLQHTDESAERLNQQYEGNRVRGASLDATDMAALKGEFEKCDVVVVCVPMAAGAGESIVQAAFDAGVEYIDLDFEAGKKTVIDRLSDKIKQSERHFIMGAGAGPGIPAALCHWGASFFECISDVTIGAIMSGENFTRGSMKDFMSIDQTAVLSYKNGEWQKASLSDGRQLDFGDPFGKAKCYPEYIPEMDGCVATHKPQRLEMLATGTNGMINLLMGVWSVLKLYKSRMLLEMGTRLGLWASRKFSKPPFGLAMKAEIKGVRNGKTEALVINLFNDHGWKATAIAVSACVKQLLEGTIQSCGADYMGHLINPDTFFKDMELMGMKTTLSSSWAKS